MAREIKKNDRYQILTPHGWRDFVGVARKLTSSLVRVGDLVCTPDHLLMVDGDWVRAGDIGVTLETGETYVYDPVEVDGHAYLSNGLVSHNCGFLGSSATLINGRIIATIPTMKPERVTTLGVKVFHPPEKDHVYVAVADVSRGLGLDYQAMVVIDVAVKPWRVAATYRNNLLPPNMFHEVIHDTVRYYNDAMILVETNDVGLRVAEDLLQIDEYENVVMTQVKGKYGTRVGGGFGQNSRYGVKTNPQVKKIGCAQLKQLVEKWQLVINDSDILWEMGRFVGKNNTYKAEDGAHDDLMMCLVLFGWLTEQKQFKENVEGSDLRAAMIAHAAEQEKWNEEDLTPFGHDDGRGDETGDLRDVQSMSWDADVKW